jgi:cytochrome P450
MELLDWIQLETIRMGGPNEALLDRVALSDLIVGDIPIKQGTALNYILRPTFFNE